MSGFATSLMEDFGPVLPPRGQDFAQRIAAGAERMDHLIRDLLSYGRINSGELRLVKTEVQPIINDIVRSLEGQATIRIESPLPTVMANATALDQVLRNLLRNAVKFVAVGVRPEVQISAQEVDGNHVRISVRDNGIGIEPRFHERIFRVFERLTANAYPGTGIGLAIVQKGVERMGGRVGVDSTPGQGSIFWIELKKAQAAGQV
jgi:signal transduction histidine kinase